MEINKIEVGVRVITSNEDWEMINLDYINQMHSPSPNAYATSPWTLLPSNPNIHTRGFSSPKDEFFDRIFHYSVFLRGHLHSMLC